MKVHKARDRSEPEFQATAKVRRKERIPVNRTATKPPHNLQFRDPIDPPALDQAQTASVTKIIDEPAQPSIYAGMISRRNRNIAGASSSDTL